MFQPIIYYLVIGLIGAVSYPLTAFIFRSWKGSCWGFSKVIGLTIISFSAWFISLWGGLGVDTAIVVGVVILICLSGILGATNLLRHEPFVKLETKTIIAEELIFIVFCLFVLLIRMGNPDIWHPIMGGEKFMDFAFINSILRSNQVPPIDPWFAGNTINYYYLGHFMVAVTIKLSGVLPAYGYNLAIAYLFGQTAVGIYSLITCFGASRLIGLLTSILAVVSGNFAQIGVIFDKVSGGYVPINGWYWTASRVMPNNEINEFPFFTFLYADLHAHMIAFPLLVLVVALGINWIKERYLSVGHCVVVIIYSSFLLAFIRATNTWDWPTCIAITISLMSLGIFFSQITNIKRKITISVLAVFSLLLLTWCFSLPFFKLYRTGQLGLEVFVGTRTTITDYLVINGFFVATGFLYLLSSLPWKNIRRYRIILFIILSLVPFVLSGYLGKFPLLPLFSTAGLLSLLVLAKTKTRNSHRLVAVTVVLFMGAIGLTLLPDVLYFSMGLGRMNMVFKYYLQAWFLFSISTGLMVWQMDVRLQNKPARRTILRIVLTIFFIGTLLYPVTAIPAKVRDRMGENQKIGLDGSAFMTNAVHYDQGGQSHLWYDLQAINWLNQNILGSPTMLEANTPSYRWGGRVSVFTGLPTVLGWGWHEIAHRSYLSSGEIVARENDVKLAYETQDLQEFLAIAKEYNIVYIYVGDLERMYYGTIGLVKFDNVGNQCFYKSYQNTSVSIYKVNQNCINE